MEACNSTVGAAHGAVNSKTCTQCGETRPLEDFIKDSRRKLGRGTWCKSCKKEYDRQYREENKEQVLESKRRYYKENKEQAHEYWRKRYAKDKDNIIERVRKWRAENGDKCKEYSRKWRAENGEKYNAQKAVKRAIRAGSLVRPDRCSQCGKKCKPEGHHDDYSKPLEVRWLCISCHNAVHKFIKLITRTNYASK